ncbi:50S ribosomal protein L24e [Aeropyrum camini]|uniref:Large ribosomal subunit protein eL24 n=1 Tax=Aeropyrum camini SY1 = JCM 12091 TaxID=1198449 RepID=U3TBP7_9CREN|nr:50S ribosomal protein L24e [Aeropyrum camini]BAN90962.1 50S ribosomal protein L24 [Aeropyrum camini SY1 = JCM 12091]
MPKSRTCSFCGGSIEPGTGVMYVLRNGQVLWFCSSKCYKNFVKLRRKPDRLEWVRKVKKSLLD